MTWPPRLRNILILSLLVIVGVKCEGEGNQKKDKNKVEYVRLPLLTFDSDTISRVKEEQEGSTSRAIESIKNEEDVLTQKDADILISELVNNITALEEEVGGEEDDNMGEEGDAEEEDEFNELDLIELVQALERQADAEERTGVFPEMLSILHGKRDRVRRPGLNSTKSMMTTSTTTTVKPDKFGDFKNSSFRIELNSAGDLELGSEDLSEFSEEIIEGISEGVEESLRMSDDLEIDIDGNFTGSGNETASERQFSVYLFQGQYYAEPRLNRFIDGALRNMGTELRVASMDPLYFRVLPRGQVAEREQPLLLSTSGVRRRRPVNNNNNVGRHLVKRQAFFRPYTQRNHQGSGLKLSIQKQSLDPQQVQLLPGGQAGRQNKRRVKRPVVAGTQVTRVSSGLNWLRTKRNQLQRQRRRRQRLRQQRIKQQQLRRQKKKNQQNKKNGNRQQQQVLLNRIRRRIRQDVGGGRIEGLSRVQRDGDAEMQLFGNYTLIRSHMKMGPIEITMQIRTKNGIRRSGATLSTVRAHTVTRVNHEGSEMIDYLLDRPHPETIQVRGNLFPMAQRIARNIFARLFLPNSFLVSKLREKAALAFLSKPLAQRKR